MDGSSLRDDLEAQYPDIVFFDGYDDCMLGVAYCFGMDPVIAYDMQKIISKLSDDGMSREEARDYFDYNIMGTWVGDRTPIFIEQVT